MRTVKRALGIVEIRYLKRLNALPMWKILGTIPARNATHRAKLCGVSRQTYYSWLREQTRPSGKRAVQLAAMTGIDLALITGIDIVKITGKPGPT